MKKLIVLLLGLTLMGNALAEEETKSESLLEVLRKKIELLTPKKKLQTTTAVGGVRGSKADANDLYWKGEKGSDAIDAEELAAFDKAVAHAEAGDMKAAEKSFSAFLKKYPTSRLRRDAQEGLAYVKDLPTATKK